MSKDVVKKGLVVLMRKIIPAQSRFKTDNWQDCRYTDLNF
jgi:hypothetical protein